MSDHKTTLDAILEIQDHTKHICEVYRTEVQSGNKSPWLDVAMIEGARQTTRSADILQRLVNQPDEVTNYMARTAIETRNNLAKIRRMMDDMFCNANETNEFRG